MELKVLENKPDCLSMEVRGESHTLLNVITEYSWLANANQASYIIEHPYMSEPKLIVCSKNPKKTLKDSSQIVIDRSLEFKKAFERALKK